MRRPRTLIATAALAAAALCFIGPAPQAQEADAASPEEAAPAEPTDVPEAPTVDHEPAPRGTRLQGSAFLARNRPVVGATIAVQEEGHPSVLFFTATDVKGAFRVGELANGSYRVEVRREGLVPVTKSAVELRFPFRAVVEVAMQPAAGTVPAVDRPAAETDTMNGGSLVLRGQARDLEGAPLDEVTVRLVNVGGLHDPREVATVGDGTFAIGDLPAGAWRFEARRVGYLPIRSALTLASDTELRLEFVRQPTGLDPSPIDLMPEEEPVPPDGFGHGAATVRAGTS